MGIINGGIQEVDASMPVFFHKPDRSDSIDVRLIRNKVVSVNYTDYFDKHPNLRGPYELTITLEFLAQIPEVEQLADADVRRRIYEDLYLSDLSHMIVDTEKYINDPNYSAASDTESRLKRENVVGKSGYIETTLTVK